MDTRRDHVIYRYNEQTDNTDIKRNILPLRDADTSLNLTGDHIFDGILLLCNLSEKKNLKGAPKKVFFLKLTSYYKKVVQKYFLFTICDKLLTLL